MQVGLLETTEGGGEKLGVTGWGLGAATEGCAFHRAVHTHTGRRMIPWGLPEKGREEGGHLQDEAPQNKWRAWGSCQDSGPPSPPCQLGSGPPSEQAWQGLVGLGSREGVQEETWAPLSFSSNNPCRDTPGTSAAFPGSWSRLRPVELHLSDSRS